MSKVGLVFKNTKNNICVIMKEDKHYYWILSKTRKGFSLNHYGKWWIDDCLCHCKYEVICDKYFTWQEAVSNCKEFRDEI